MQYSHMNRANGQTGSPTLVGAPGSGKKLVVKELHFNSISDQPQNLMACGDGVSVVLGDWTLPARGHRDVAFEEGVELGTNVPFTLPGSQSVDWNVTVGYEIVDD